MIWQRFPKNSHNFILSLILCFIVVGYLNNTKFYKYQAEKHHNLGEYNQALRLNPKDSNTYNNRGEAYGELEEYEKAIKNYNQAIRFEPKFALAYKNRGYIFSF